MQPFSVRPLGGPNGGMSEYTRAVPALFCLVVLASLVASFGIRASVPELMPSDTGWQIWGSGGGVYTFTGKIVTFWG